jgi:hypothetical protein
MARRVNKLIKIKSKPCNEPCKPNIKNPFYQILVLTLKIIDMPKIRELG